MTIEVVQREHARVMEKLSVTDPLSAEYGTLLEREKELSKILFEFDKQDQDRLNNNARNDIQEEQLKIEKAKIKTGWIGNVITIIGIGAQVGVSIFGMKYAYHQEGELFHLPGSKTCQNIATKLLSIKLWR